MSHQIHLDPVAVPDSLPVADSVEAAGVAVVVWEPAGAHFAVAAVVVPIVADNSAERTADHSRTPLCYPGWALAAPLHPSCA